MRNRAVYLAWFMRDAGLSKEQWRDEADLELERICLEDGM